MSFLSLQFAGFLIAGLFVFHLAPARFRGHVLLALSYAFYLCASAPHALLLLGATVFVHLAAQAIQKNRSEGGKLRVTVLAVAGLVLVLVGFKCAGLLAETMQALWTHGGADAALLLAAPLGLSYYLFKLMGYLLDVYWEKIPVERNFVSLALYASFFPQMVSGPIQRAGDFLPQLQNLGRPEPADFTAGLRRILFGLFKKLVIADNFTVLVARVHAAPAEHSSLELLVGAYCFALQLYADFSGMTDIALGLGQLFGLKGPENFQMPFFARNVQDFWRRWHISLSSWLSDYLFTPLRMSLRRLDTVGLALAIFLNMIAVGLWHGPTRTYLAFGIINGVFMVVSALTLKKRNAWFKTRSGWTRLRTVAAPLLTFHMMVFAFIFFRAGSLAHVFDYVRHLLPGFSGGEVAAFRLDLSQLGLGRKEEMIGIVASLAGVAVMEVVHWLGTRPDWRERFLAAPRVWRWGFYYAAVLIVFALGKFGTQKFIYEQF